MEESIVIDDIFNIWDGLKQEEELKDTRSATSQQDNRCKNCNEPDIHCDYTNAIVVCLSCGQV